MSDKDSQREPDTDTSEDELDTDGQAFKWALVDGKGSSRLRQTWTPDDEPKANSSGSGTSKPDRDNNKTR